MKIKSILFFLILLFVSVNAIGETKNLGIYTSSKKNIKISADKAKNWRFAPEKTPDDLHVYCETKNTEVTFFLPEKTLSFRLNENDTVLFSVLVNDGKDTARVRVIGIKTIPNSILPQEKLYHLSRLWSEAKYNFVNMDNIDFSWDSLYYQYIHKVMDSKNDYEYARLMKAFIASLKDGHTTVSIGYNALDLYEDYVPMSLSDFDKRIYITFIRKGIGLDSNLLGAEILSISGISTPQYLEDSIFPYIAASTEQHLWMQGTYALSSDLRTKNFRATAKKRNGDIVALDIKRNGEAKRTEQEEYYGPVPSRSRYDLVRLDWLKDSIAYLYISSFYPVEEVCGKLYALQEQINKAKALVVDIRKNGGGATNVGWFLQSQLTPPGQDWFLNYAWSTRINDGVKKANGNWIEEYKDYYTSSAIRYEDADTVYIGDTILRYTMPTVILIGRYTFSAAEDFLVNLYEVPKRPLLMGSATGGSTGAPLVVSDMPLGGYARICTRRICYPYSKTPFLQTGVVPDIIVNETIEDYLDGKDVVLERAVEYLETINE